MEIIGFRGPKFKNQHSGTGLNEHGHVRMKEREVERRQKIGMWVYVWWEWIYVQIILDINENKSFLSLSRSFSLPSSPPKKNSFPWLEFIGSLICSVILTQYVSDHYFNCGPFLPMCNFWLQWNKHKNLVNYLLILLLLWTFTWSLLHKSNVQQSYLLVIEGVRSHMYG